MFSGKKTRATVSLITSSGQSILCFPRVHDYIVRFINYNPNTVPSITLIESSLYKSPTPYRCRASQDASHAATHTPRVLSIRRDRCASNHVTLKTRSPSVCRSDSASLRLDSGSILSVTDSERTISTVESSTLSEYFSFRSTNVGSSISLPDSVRTVTKRDQDSYTSSPTLAYSEDMKKITKLSASDIIVLFLGLTGSGKSHIIDTLTGQPGRRAGSHLESCTTGVRAVRLFNHASYGNRLVLVDTPGFDNTCSSDLEILEIVSKWLRDIYEKNIKLAGIVYLHRITDNMTGSHCRNLRMLGELCGDQAIKTVILVTTMWDKTYYSDSGKRLDEQEGELEKLMPDRVVQREKNLFDNYWKIMIDHGASTGRFTNSPRSAWKIIDTVTKQHKAEVLLLQEELVDLNRALHETQAGKTFYSDLQKLLAEQRDTVHSLAQQARNERNPQLAAKLEAELNLIQKDFYRTFKGTEDLKIPIDKRIALFFSKKSRARPIRI